MSTENDEAITEHYASSDASFLEQANPKNECARLQLVMSRYKEILQFLPTLKGAGDEQKISISLVDQLKKSVHSSKVLFLQNSGVEEVVALDGYDASEIKSLKENKKNICQSITTLFESEPLSVIFLESNDKRSEEINGFLFLDTFLVARIQLGGKEYYLVCGVAKDAEHTLSIDDTYWFSLLGFIFESAYEKLRASSLVREKNDENLRIAEEKERLIEERTRALLDALFDAKKFRIVLELADVIVVLIDAAGRRIVYANLLFEKVTGYKREDVVERKTIEILNLVSMHKQVAMFSPEFDAIVRDLGALRENYICTTAHGDERELTLSISRIEEEGGGALYVLIGRDVTDEREVERKEKQHIEELEKLNQLMINRELRIIELKQQLAQAT